MVYRRARVQLCLCQSRHAIDWIRELFQVLFFCGEDAHLALQKSQEVHTEELWFLPFLDRGLDSPQLGFWRQERTKMLSTLS